MRISQIWDVTMKSLAAARQTTTRLAPARLPTWSSAWVLMVCVPSAVLAQDDVGLKSAVPLFLIGITTPYREATLSAVRPGRIAQIHVEEGVSVKQGDLVFQMVDDVQRARTAMAKATADSLLGVDLARAVWERDKRELARLTKLHGDANASSKELDDARAAEEIARIEHELAGFDHAQAMLAYEREKAQLDEHRAVAPFSGYVEERLKQVGETVDESEGVIRLAQLDPLRVWVDCPLSVAALLHTGDQLVVRPFDDRWSPRTGTVVMASRVADSASQTFKVKLTVPNANGTWMSGLKVAVEISPGVATANRAVGHGTE